MKKALNIVAVVVCIPPVLLLVWLLVVKLLFDYNERARPAADNKREARVARVTKILATAKTDNIRVIAMHGLVNAQLANGNTDEARKIATELLALMPNVQGADRPTPLAIAAKTSLFLGNLEDARKYSDELLTMAAQLLPSATNNNAREIYGRAINHGNGMLGRLALREGRVEEAKQFLMASGEAPGPNGLTPFNTNMLLAKELLGKGEREAVLQYFEVCRIAWKKPMNTTEPNLKYRESKNQFARNQNAQVDQGIDAWVSVVKAGKVPVFTGYYVN